MLICYHKSSWRPENNLVFLTKQNLLREVIASRFSSSYEDQDHIYVRDLNQHKCFQKNMFFTWISRLTLLPHSRQTTKKWLPSIRESLLMQVSQNRPAHKSKICQRVSQENPSQWQTVSVYSYTHIWLKSYNAYVLKTLTKKPPPITFFNFNYSKKRHSHETSRPHRGHLCPQGQGQCNKVAKHVIWNRLTQKISILNMNSVPCLDQMLQARLTCVRSVKMENWWISLTKYLCLNFDSFMHFSSIFEILFVLFLEGCPTVEGQPIRPRICQTEQKALLNRHLTLSEYHAIFMLFMLFFFLLFKQLCLWQFHVLCLPFILFFTSLVFKFIF